MRHKINRISVFVLLFCIQSVVTQAQRIADSLNTILLQKDLPTENRVMTMGLLAKALSTTDAKKALEIGLQTLQLSRTLPDLQYRVFAFGTLTNLYYRTDDMPKAQIVSDSALWYAGKTTSREMKGFAWFKKAWLETLLGKPKESMQSSLEALKYLEGTDAYSYQFSVYYNIAGIYSEWNDLPAKKKYALLAVQAAEKSGDFDNLLMAEQGMAAYYHYCYKQNKKNTALLDSSLFYNHKAINLYYTQKQRITLKSTMAIIALNTANLYQSYFPASYKDSVFYYLNMSLKIGLETKHIDVISNCYGMMSDLEIERGNYQKAEALLDSGLVVLRADSVSNLHTMVQFMMALSNLAEKKGDKTAALKYYKEYHRKFEELFDAEKLAITKQLDVQYQSEKNEAALKSLRQTAALNKKLNYLYIFLTIVASIALLLLFGSYHFRLKATRHQQQLLEKEKEDAELRVRLKEEEAMRLMAEQQLLQERQDRLQKDLLAGSLQVEQKDELLQAVQKKIEESKSRDNVLRQINQIIDQNKRIDDTIGAYKADFDNINPEFFEKLKEKSANSLSRLDLKHCSYISIGLTNKEIAQRLGIAPKSILMARYRIKLKLGLGKEIDLDEYIRTL